MNQINTSAKLPVGTSPENAVLHKRVEWFCLILLIGLVIEGALTFPGLLLYFGWPTLSMEEIATEFDRHQYNDPTRRFAVKEFYGPPFGGVSDGHGQTTSVERGSITQPQPGFRRMGFREIVRLHEVHEAEARQAAAAARANGASSTAR